jgi:hypothetical protein
MPMGDGSCGSTGEESDSFVHELPVLMVVLLFWEYRRRRQSKRGKKR